MGVLAEMGVRVLDSTWKDWGFGLGAGGSGKQPRTGRLAGRLGVRASGQGWDVWRAFKDGTFELDMGALAGRWGAGRLNSAWRPEQVAGGQGAEGLSGRESSYSGRAASVSSKHL